ncbi:hypothetical protein B0T10DRAFT_481277 [Thelonectria olida]|uniref:Succinate dehydrogenase cytochrome b560 subunit n=1 Tax=Thelonectria olida TaxID=1576542 RepID=A0A9P8WC66_9HYPO|nr:hypothetical protein B0T10DRAFT_481277 [Thelonectria olida]
MIAQRVGVAALRRGAAGNVFFNQTIPKVALTAGISTSSPRTAVSAAISQAEGQKILADQRLSRPVSPHLGIYKIEQTWFGTSAWTRITGTVLSGSLYLYMGAYLAAPLAGLHIETASLVTALSTAPVFLKGGLKFALGFPFAYHALAGVRHLVYDAGKGFPKATIIKSDKILWASSIVGGLILAFFV